MYYLFVLSYIVYLCICARVFLIAGLEYGLELWIGLWNGLEFLRIADSTVF